ncbi:MAG: hypothetical protein JSU85_11425 [Candidatus Zixiibacteriota bacterium]|nr:MAG: hypothetical protein JSU85_11425 [candidate division Zixibacteria bacterium]
METTLIEFEEKIEEIKQEKGYQIVKLEYVGVWIIKFYRKENEIEFAKTGATLSDLMSELKAIPFNVKVSLVY